MTSEEMLLMQAYQAFNARDIDTVRPIFQDMDG